MPVLIWKKRGQPAQLTKWNHKIDQGLDFELQKKSINLEISKQIHLYGQKSAFLHLVQPASKFKDSSNQIIQRNIALI